MTDWQMVGSWADWTTAATAFLALAVASVAGVATWKTNQAQQETLELQRRQFEAEQERQERAQAIKVTYCLSSITATKSQWTGWSPEATKTDVQTVAFAAVNASDTPIYMVTLIEGHPEPRLLYAGSTLFPTGSTPKFLADDVEVDWPDRSRRLYFEDSAGTPWIREVSGKLRNASDEEIAIVLRLHGILENSSPDNVDE